MDEPLPRREALRCMAWAGAGTLWALNGGVASASTLGAGPAPRSSSFNFVQLSDSHIGFAKPQNPDARATFREAVGKVIALPDKPDFILHTGDITQLSRDSEFDDAEQIMRETGVPVFRIPGEHDMLDEGGGKAFLAHHGKGTLGAGWYSFDHKGVHFVAMVNVANLKAGGAGQLGREQIEWLAKDLAGRPSSTPIVVAAHIPLWTVYADWGWGTDDATEALRHLRRFGSVTILNGHIHQIVRKVEGHMSFHTARSTAFPQPAPGTAPSPGPMQVPAGQLRAVLGITTLDLHVSPNSLALTDTTLA